MASSTSRPKVCDVISDNVEDFDTEIKAICYDVTSNNAQAAIAGLERLRRKLKAMQGKCETLSKLEETEYTKTCAINSRLSIENSQLRRKVEILKMHLSEYEDETFDLSSSSLQVKTEQSQPLFTSTPEKSTVTNASQSALQSTASQPEGDDA